mgnify:CR=1 FL=1
MGKCKFGKTISVLLAFMMLIPSMISVSAEESPVIDWTVDFSENAGAALWNKWGDTEGLSNSKSGWDAISLERGADAQVMDREMKLADGSGTKTNTAALRWATRANVSNQNTRVEFRTDKTLEVGQTVNISFDFAMEDETLLSRYIIINNDTSAPMQLAQLCGDSFRINGVKYNAASGGYVGMDSNGRLMAWRWHHLEYRLGIMQDGTYVIVYLNGKKLDEFKSSVSIKSFKNMAFTAPVPEGGGVAVRTWLDNFNFKVLNKETLPSADDARFKLPVYNLKFDTPMSGMSIPIANEKTVAKHDFAGGIFGKQEDDRALRLYNEEKENAGEDPFHFLQTGWSNRLKYGETEDFEVRFAYDDIFAGLRLWPRNYGWIDAVTIKNDGTISAFKDQKTARLNMERGKWYKLNVVTSPASETESKFNYKIFIDNNLVFDGEYQFSGTTGRWEGFKSLRVGNTWNTTGVISGSGNSAIYKKSTMYIDDIKVTHYTAADLENADYAAVLAHGKITLSHSNTFINKYMSDNGRISSYILPDVSADDYMNGLTAGNAESVMLNGDNTGLMYGKSAEIKTLSGEKLYLTPNAETKTVLKPVISGSGISGLSPVSANFTTYEYKASVAGRAEEDYAAFISVTDKDTEEHVAPALMGGSGTTAPTMLTTSVYVGKGSAGIARLLVNYVSDYNKSAQECAVQIDGKGNVRINEENKVVGKAALNGWNKIEMVTYPGSGNIDLRLNGKLIAENVRAFKNTVDYYERFKWEASMYKQMLGSSKFGFADIELKSGAYADFASETSLVSTNEEYIPYNRANVLYVPELASVADIYTEFENSGSVRNVYADSSMTAGAEEDLADGNVVVIEKDGVFKYYTVKTGIPGLETLGIKYSVNGDDTKYKFENGKLNISAEFEGTGEKAVELYVARYVDGKLAEVAKTTKTVNGTDSVDAEFDVTDATGRIKVIAADGSLAPLCEALVIPGK